MLDIGPVGLSVAMALKMLYLRSAVLLYADTSEMIPESEAMENFAACSRE